MNNIAILGTQWGDESKGRLTHDLSAEFDYVIRFSGGSNVGAMVYRNGKKYIHHLLPAVDYTKSKAKSFLGSGMVIHMEKLLSEIKEMEQDFRGIGKSVIVDPDAFVVLDKYIEEDKITGKEQGTTSQGIKQAYTAKVAREGTRVYNLLNDNAPIIGALKEFGVQFIPSLALQEVFEKSNLLFEGNQSIMLSLSEGLYPYITSSDCTVSGIYAGGFNWVDLNKVYGVAKVYNTRSGGKELPTEIKDENAVFIRNAGNERGNTTGRDRGIGWLDLPALKYACRKGGITHLAISKFDILNGQKTVKVCNSYGKEVFSPNDFRDIKPEYIDVQGWNNASNIEEILPFISVVEKYVNVPVEYVSFGVERNQLRKLK